MELTKEIKAFIMAHKNDNVQSLALKLSKQSELPRQLILQQIQGLQIAKKKLPSWVQEDILFPAKVALEQCSSEITAQYKSSIYSYTTFADLSGGFGVDTKHFADHSEKGVYVESYRELFELTSYNLSLFHPKKVDYFNETAESFLEKNNAFFDLIYLDPDRRSDKHTKGVALADCTPNVIEIKDQLFEFGRVILIKVSPLIDIKTTIHQLKEVSRVDVISVNNECKEVLFTLEKETSKSIKIHTINFTKNELERFDFDLISEERSNNTYSLPKRYLFEPNSSILKAGGFKTIGDEFDLYKIAPNSHLYTSDILLNEFPGRIFEIVSVTSKIKRLPKKANIISRNHPFTPEQIKTKGKIKDGGDDYIIASSDLENNPIYIIAKRLK